MSSRLRWRIRTRGSFGRFFHVIRNTAGNTPSEPDHERPSRGGLKGILQHLPGDGKGSRPLLLEPDVWIGKVNTDALGAMRGKQAEIHPLPGRRLRSNLPKGGSRLRYIGPPLEAGYTSAIATSKPEPNRPLQSGGVHIHPHRTLNCQAQRRRSTSLANLGHRTDRRPQDHRPRRALTLALRCSGSVTVSASAQQAGFDRRAH